MSQRIVIFGRPGSGKSTFACQLSKNLSIPVYHLDKFFWTANWKERDNQEFLQIQQDLVNQERWIIDGNALASLEMRYARADVVLYFNYPKWLCLYRVFKRLWDKNKNIDDRAEGCDEIVKSRFIPYLWTFEKRGGFYLKTLKDQYPQVKLVEVVCDEDLKKMTFLLETTSLYP